MANTAPHPHGYVWHPSDEIKRSANWTDFLRFTNSGTYEALCARADADPEWFWDAMIRYSGFRFRKPYTKLLDVSQGLPHAKWCIGATANMTETCLDRNLEKGRGGKPAIVWQGEDGVERAWTYAELASETARITAGLDKLGIKPGDVVGLYMPLMPEAAAALFAVARMGAILLPLFSGFGPEPIVARLVDAEAKCVITVDGTLRRGKHIAMKPVLDEALATVPTVAHVIVVNRMGDQVPMKAGRDHWLKELVPTAPALQRANEVEADAPFMLAYTSGTTGRPKGIIHTHVGLTVKTAQDFQLSFDLKESDRMLWMTDMGWLVGPIQIMSAALAGATLIMAEGAPDYPGPDRIWKLVEKHKVSFLGLGPTLARVLMRHGVDVPAGYDLSSIRVAASTGEPWDHTSWFWVFEKVLGKRAPLFNYSGGTEMGGIVGTHILYPIKPGSFHGALPGTGGDILDEATGKPVPPGVMGELVMSKPCIGLTRGVWKSPDRYMDYWSRIPGIWVHGDWASRDTDGVWYIHGRSDDTLKIGGKRTGPAEIESVLMATGAVSDAAVVGIPDPRSGSAVAIAVVAGEGQKSGSELAATLSQAIVAGHGSPFKPARVLFVAELPKTRNMKTMRRLVRAALTGDPPGDLSALVNPEAFDALREAAKRPG